MSVVRALSHTSVLGLVASLASLSAAESHLPRFGPVWVLVSEGYRTMDLNWNSAGDLQGQNPNVFQEMDFKNITAYQTTVAANSLVGPASIRGELDYGIVNGGTNRMSFYDEDDRANEFERSENAADSGTLINWLGAVGFRTQSLTGAWRFTPEIGYASHHQDLEITNGVEVIPDNGPVDGLNSSYVAEWEGPFIAARGSWKFWPRWILQAHVDYHLINFSAEGNLNLRTDLQHPDSFEQDARGTGWTAGLNLAFQPHQRVVIHGGFEWETWEAASSATYRVNFADGAVEDSKLNEVTMESILISIGVGVSFH